MKTYYITFRSVTYAQRGERVLQKKGIQASLQRTPRWMEEKGCGYCLRLRTASPGASVEALRQARLPWRRVYAQQGDGQMEEVML